MSVKIELTEWKGLEALAEGILQEIRPDAMIVMKTALVRFERIIKETLSGVRTGRTYIVSKTGKVHIASAPGEPPAVLEGNLRNSVGHSEPQAWGWEIRGEVGVGLGQPPKGDDVDPAKSYARRLELGGVDSRGVMIEPRPYMAPAADKAEPMITALFEEKLGS